MLESKKNRSISRRDLVKVASAGVGTIALGGGPSPDPRWTARNLIWR